MRFVSGLLGFALFSCHPPDAPTSPSTMPFAPTTLAGAPSQKMIENHAAGLSKNPPGLRYEVRFADAKNRFMQGEPIRIELSFSSSRPDTYRLDKALYDRSGRLGLDTYVLDPDDAVDPLVDYSEYGLGGMGGVRNMPILGEKPEKMVFALNEYKRFDRPGHYRLYVQSSRIDSDGQGRAEAPSVTSNMLELDIEPMTPAFAVRALADALVRLDAKDEDDQRRGAVALRFLGTEAAALEMVRRFHGGRFDYQLQFGLIGSTHRTMIVKAMEARIDEDAPVTLLFLHTLARLRDKLDHGSSFDPVRRTAVVDGYATRLAGALSKRSAANRAVCVSTLVELSGQHDKTSPAYLTSARAAIPGVFRDLTSELMSTLLASQWWRIKQPSMLPVLRDLYADPNTSPDLREAALHRLLELDPTSARARIIDHLRTGSPPLGVLAERTLGALSDATLAELDASLAERLEKDAPGVTAAMLARYATAGPLPRVKAVYARHATAWATDIEGHFLGYFFRVDPAFGVRAAKAVLAKRQAGAGRALAIAAADTMTPALERVLIEALDSQSADMVSDAAAALAKYGSKAAEGALWKRLERFHAEWKAREAELRDSVIDRMENRTPRQIEAALWNALTAGRSWIVDAEGWKKLESLVVSASAKQQLANHSNGLQGPIQLSVRRWNGEVHVRVAQYELDSLAALDDKLAQFLKGTAFAWQPSGEDPADFARVKAVIDKLGMSLAR